uniref:CS domain-containing protein n=1 Tax=Heterorhabditis bacteriophora TaxID=37862 RepID=A0A1I7X492_HETBA
MNQDGGRIWVYSKEEARLSLEAEVRLDTVASQIELSEVGLRCRYLTHSRGYPWDVFL